MFQKLLGIIRQVISRMVNKNTIESELNIDVAVSPEMAAGIDLWGSMYINRSPWLNKDVKSINLPAEIASEMARLITLEMDTQISGSARAEYLNRQYQPLVSKLRRYCEYGCAKGGILFKPYIDGGAIAVDCVQADQFFPTAFNSNGDITGMIAPEYKTVGNTLYTRLERHELTSAGYQITNMAFKQRVPQGGMAGLGKPCLLGEVREWAGLEANITIKNVQKPLFGYFKMPLANSIDTSSPLGVSVYARAAELIKQADEQYSRLLWEFEGSELAIDADAIALKDSEELPRLNQRLFRRLNLSGGAGDADFYNVFSPAIRDQSLINGLNAILRKVEFACGLAYGTLSDVQDVDKTAEEIKASKQRSFSTVSDAQKSLEKALIDLVYAMDVWATVGNLAPAGKYEISFHWDDSLITDRLTEFNQRMQLVSSGQLKPALNIAWYFGVPEEEAEKMVPDSTSLFGAPGVT